MELTYYTAAATTGILDRRSLPLQNVRFASTLMGSGGEFSADLDLRACYDPADATVDPIAEAAAVLDLVQPGVRSIVPVMESTTNGTAGDVLDVSHGEWWITGLERDHTSPVVRVTGVEWDGYASHQVIGATHKGKGIQPVGKLRELARTLWSGIQLDVPNWHLPPVTPVDFQVTPGQATFASAFEELASDQLEWHVTTALEKVTGGVRSTRALAVNVPMLRQDYYPYVVLWVNRDGGMGGSALGYRSSTSVEAMCFDLWANGAGAGNDQVTAHVTASRPPGMPNLSRQYTSRRQLKANALRRQAQNVLRHMTPAYEPVTVVARQQDVPGGGPHVGDVYQIGVEPTLSYPTPERYWARVTAWAWQEPRPGELDTYTLTMERL